MVDQKTPKLPTGKLTKKSNYSFDYQFTAPELEEKAQQLARTTIEKGKIEQEKKMVTAQFTAKIESKTSEIGMLAQHINDGFEYMTKTCECEMDFDNGKKTYFFEGNNIGEEKMTEADYQLHIEMPEEEGTN